ncbi:ABC transporter ATP-binding protein [Tenacibaculum jejuense]|uniref:ABC-type multidrug transport system, ATPase component n=1 Tax=Tenacibaculum jejuense TaxID=584609 RepID=A0A238U4X2_9FLAO|nr:ATP-binding cassette domain-containing protein [Tenacibaculum jejuense]SNR14251.1 ABC-type multidrug transport system, ATPase component [Tenacibaculum jejuense]
MISIKNLSKKYGRNSVLNNINIDFEEGKAYGIVGENGAGKTTFFNCLSGIENYNGNIISISNLKDTIGFLQTEFYFFPKITGREYIQLLLNAREVSVKDIDKRNIFDLPLDKYAVNYSTGMKKKLALTAILLQENKVFIFDEPFNGVDIQSNIVITEIIHQLKKLNKLVIISSHIFSTLATTCDEIHVLEKGSFVKKVMKEDFTELEDEMKAKTLLNTIDKLGLK